MNSSLLAFIGLSRLRLPVPTAKLLVAHHAAKLLQSGECQDELWEALLDWIPNLEFESEVVEALVIPLLAKSAAAVSSSQLRHAINKPSLLSDLLINQISGNPTLINTWIKAHSGEVPHLFFGKELISELTSGRFVPLILSNRLKRLEEGSGKPYLRQWAFEYQRLLDTYGTQGVGVGQLEYFSDSDRGRNNGQFVTRRGHVARSAYLRALALAVDVWGMPERLAFDEAMYASPVDLCFLRMPPGVVPEWTESFLEKTPATQEQWEDLILAIDERLAQDGNHSSLVHLDSPVALTQNYKADIEVITFLHDAVSLPGPEEPWQVHGWLPGNLALERTSDSRIQIIHQGELLFPLEAGGHLAPGLLPAVINHVGYMHTELLARLPYLPANYPSQHLLIATPHTGGMDITNDGTPVGVVEHWNYRWSPMHDKSLGPHCGVAARMSPPAVDLYLAIPGMTLSRCWRAKVLTREKDYGEWKETVFGGCLPCKKLKVEAPMIEKQGATNPNALMFPAEELERVLEQIIGLLDREFMPVIKEGFLIKRSFARPKITKATIKKVALRIQTEMLALSKLDFRDPEARKQFWPFLNRLVRDITPKNMRPRSKNLDVLTETLRSSERNLGKLKHTAGMSQSEWRSVMEAIVTLHHLAYRTGPEHHEFEYWKSRRIVSTYQAIGRIWKLMTGRWPKMATEKLLRLVRIYGEAATVFEHMLRYHLEMLSDLPRPDGSRSTKPQARATLGTLIRQAEQYPELEPLLVEVDVPLRNAIHHSTYRVIPVPTKLVWPGPHGPVEERLADFKKRVKRLVVVTQLFLMGQQISGMQILAKGRYLLSDDMTDISKRFPNLYTSQCKVDPFPS